MTGPVHTVSKIWGSQRNVLSQISNEIAGAPLSRYTYTVNALGQRTEVATTGSAFGGSPANWSWGYNAKGEVTSATHGSVASRNSAWTFDDIGNRLTQSVGTVPAVTSYTTNLLNQYTTISHPAPSAETLVHDLDGNLIQDATKKYVWDAENRLKQVLRASDDAVIASYQYDHLGRRVRKTTTSLAPQGAADVAYGYDGWNVVVEYVMPGGFSFVSRTRTWGVDLSGSLQGAGGVGGLLADGDALGGLWYPTYDGNGNVSEYLSKTAATTAHYEYDAFGNTVFASGALSAPAFACRFSTKALDPETGWYYYGYRYYFPISGRWLSRDPIGTSGGSNIYAFLSNGPPSKFDWLGLTELLQKGELIQAGTFQQLDAEYGKGTTPFATLGDSAIGYANQIFRPIGVQHSKWTAPGVQKAQSADGNYGVGNYMFFVRWKIDSPNVKLKMTETHQVTRSHQSKPQEPVPNANPQVLEGVNVVAVRGTYIKEGAKGECVDVIWADAPGLNTYLKKVGTVPNHDAKVVVSQTLTLQEGDGEKQLEQIKLKITVNVNKDGTVTGSIARE